MIRNGLILVLTPSLAMIGSLAVGQTQAARANSDPPSAYSENSGQNQQLQEEWRNAPAARQVPNIQPPAVRPAQLRGADDNGTVDDPPSLGRHNNIGNFWVAIGSFSLMCFLLYRWTIGSRISDLDNDQ